MTLSRSAIVRSLALCAATLLAPLPAQDAATAEASDAPPTLKADKVHWIRPSGTYRDLPEQGGDFSSLLLGGGGQPKPFYRLTEQILDLTVADGAHVLLDLSGTYQLNSVQLAELDRVLRRVKDSGKKLWCYVENASTATMQLAAVCDEVMIADLGVVELASPALTVMFLRDALDLLGVRIDVVRCGDFKGAVEPFMLQRMSGHLRAHYRALLEHINAAAVQRIAAGVELSSSRIRSAQEQVVFTAREAREQGFVDHVVPWQGAKHALRQITGNDELDFVKALLPPSKREQVNPLQFLTQLFNPQDADTDVEFDSVVVLHLQGGIVDGTKPVPGSIVAGPTVELIRGLLEDDSAKGVVVRINSPGGSATASEAILLALRDLAAHKPVVVSMGEVAASGGYYVSCIDRPILVEETTITGSIGVFGMRPSFGPLLRRVGINEEVVSLDDGAAMMSLSRPWTDEQTARVQRVVDNIYDVFVGHVARSRNLTSAEVLEIAGGRVWSGQQAIEHGLADRIGGLYDAVAAVAAEAGLAQDDYEITHLPRPKSFFEALAASMAETEILSEDPAVRLAARRLLLDRALRLVFAGLQHPDRPTTVWALMPDVIRFR